MARAFAWGLHLACLFPVGNSFFATRGRYRVAETPRSLPRVGARNSDKPTARTRRARNAQGIFFVSEGCINCGACTWMAPGTFATGGFKSYVARQPAEAEEVRRAAHAMAR